MCWRWQTFQLVSVAGGVDLERHLDDLEVTSIVTGAPMTRHRPFTARQRLATKVSTLLGASSVAATASAKEPTRLSADQSPVERLVRDDKAYLWVDATRWWIDENGNAVAILQNQNRRVWEADEFIVVDQWLYACEDSAWLFWLFGSGLLGGGAMVVDDDDLNPPPANRQPVANDDAVSTNSGTAISIPVSDLLDNDSDPDGDPLSIIQVGTASNGTVTLSDDGTNVTYSPNDPFHGTDSFTYSISDGNGGTATGTVTVGVNALPIAADDAVETTQGTAITIPAIDLLDNDSDPDNDPLSIIQVGAASNGTVTLSDDGTNVTYSPNDPFHGTDSFTYSISDGNGGTATGTVTVTVNASVEAIEDAVEIGEAVEINEDTIISILASDLLENDRDLNGGTLTIIEVSNTTNGTVTLSDDGSNVTFDPDESFIRSGSFDYTVSNEQGRTATATVIITKRFGARVLIIDGLQDAHSFPTLGFGTSVSSAGDVNGDGRDELLITAPNYSATIADRITNHKDDLGQTYLFDVSDALLNAADGSVPRLDTTAASLLFRGSYSAQLSGLLAETIGDINKDGHADYLIGEKASDADQSVFAAYVVFGRDDVDLLDSPDISAAGIDGTNGFFVRESDTKALQIFPGVVHRPFAPLGDKFDFNGDGIDDLLLTHFDSRLVGTVGRFSMDLTILFGIDSVAGESFDDGDNSGAFQLTATPLRPSDLTAKNGLQITVPDITDPNPFPNLEGHAAASAGDVNDDGFGDLIIGAPHHVYDGQYSGVVYVLYGGSDGVVANNDGTAFDLGAVDALTAEQGFVIVSDESDEGFGAMVSSVGDINNDGVEDVGIGTLKYQEDPGRIYIMFGANNMGHPGFDGDIHVSDWANQDAESPLTALGFVVTGLAPITDVASYYTVLSAGDMNGDSILDVMVSKSSLITADTDEVYVIFGKDSQAGDYFGNEFDVRELDGSNGFQIIGPQARNIKTVAPAGDVNGDGYDDIVLGSPYSAYPNVDMGEAYVVYGQQYFDPTVKLADFVDDIVGG